MKRKGIILLLLIAALFATSCSTVELSQEDKDFINTYYVEYESDLFDAENIVLTFAAMSDIHIGGKNQNVKFGNALSMLNRRAKNGIDAFLFVGDMTDTSGSKVEDKEIKTFKKVVQENRGKDTSIIYVLGNHDQNDEPGLLSKMFYNTFGKSFYNLDQNDEKEILEGRRHWILNGYHFLGIDFDWNNQKYTEGDILDWVDSKLKEITEKEPEKPVFFAVHVPPGSNLDRVLAKYPQVICFSGHTHIPLNTDRAIKQSNYTFLACGGMYYYRQYTHEGKMIDDLGEKYDFYQGYLVDVDKDHNVRIIRMDFNNNSSYTPEWIIPTPKEDKSHLLHTEDLKKKTPRPYFEDSEIDFSDSLTRTLVGKFKSAKTENINPVEYYEVTLWEKDKTEKKYISTYYPITKYEDFPDENSFRFLRVGDEYGISITAYDCHGSSSNNLLFSKGIYFVDIRSNLPDKANIKAYNQGQNVRVRITPPAGYTIDSISAEGIELDDTMSFDMPENNVIINVVYKQR